MEPYRELEHTADVGLTINGSTIPELFLNSIKGLFYLISPSLKVCVKSPVCPSIKDPVIIELKAATEEELLVYWLNEFIYYFFVKDMFPKRIEIDNLGNGRIRARVYFKKRAKTIQIAAEIKAATYHNLVIKRVDTLYKVEVIFDI